MAFNIDPATLDLKETVVVTRRVSKTVKGGRIMRFAAVVVVGDQNGHVGYGLGKSAEVPEAIRKAIEDAKKNMIEVSLKGTSHSSRNHRRVRCGKSSPQARSRRYRCHRRRYGRAVLDLAGIRDIRAKSLRSNNKINVVKATFEGLRALRSAEEVAKIRGKAVEDMRK